ncbi:aminotransferase class V-fold PLP-dependent enzyme [Hephaestia caeni]|uniref:aminotransferase class V-fold PLP-dependent enzyme n=1 Tax=Hephaestia caeni TaxID=645617 RepID=UPI0014744C56|nr:aminotransferase class V-fold PLP-dependent enzyme [Hephaestia caeni]
MITRRHFVGGGVAGSIAPPLIAQGPPARDPAGDFPITARGRAFLDTAYIGPMSTRAQRAAADFARAKAERPLEVGELLRGAERVRAKFARLINASPDEIGLLFSTAEGENVIAAGLDLRPGDNVVIDDLHYDTEFVLYRALERTRGIELRVARNRGGAAGVAAFAPLVDRRTRLLSVAWVSHRNGFRHDMRALADLAHAHGALLYADAIQAVGAIAIDVHATGVDSLCAGSYKWLFAGWGVAPFFVRREVIERLRLDRYGEMHASGAPETGFTIDPSARRFDYSSRAFGEVHVLDAALDHLAAIGIDRIEAHGVGLAHRLHAGAERLGLRCATPAGNRAPIVAIALPGPEDAAKAAFAVAGVEATVRAGHVRLAPAIFNTDADVDRAIEVLGRLARS